MLTVFVEYLTTGLQQQNIVFTALLQDLNNQFLSDLTLPST